ncbi:RPS6 [Symbiodinium natans]|uniref:RPS6 protein n=1 Tax=Symbiodinium natans TaxID=878477 RepID=A0A812P224_9DINO|nr:RPS6 [Symbiodinium natans]
MKFPNHHEHPPTSSTQRARQQHPPFFKTVEVPRILVDLDNMEAAATAFVLLGLVRKKVMASGGAVPHVLMKEKKVPPSVKAVLLICSDGCFHSAQVAAWLLQVLTVKNCALLPIIAEDGFRFPSESFYDQLLNVPDLQVFDLATYTGIIRAVFQEIAVVFSPQNYSSTAEDLELRATQVAWRLTNGLQPLARKLNTDAEAEATKVVEENGGDTEGAKMEDTMFEPKEPIQELDM